MSNEVFEVELTPDVQKFYNDKNNFGVYSCMSSNWELLEFDYKSRFTIVGNMPRLNINANYKAELQKKLHPRYGVSYEVKSIMQLLPSSVSEQKAYLETILTDNQVRAIYEVYSNEDVIKLFQENTFDYKKVKGIGEATYKNIRERVLENLNIQKALSRLSRYNITYNMILKLIRHFESAELAIQKVEENPYSLTDVSGIGFLKADSIAQSMNFDRNSPFRIRAGIEYVIEQEQFNGHTYIVASQLIETTVELLNLSQDLIIEQVKQHENLMIIDNKIALKRTYDAEKYVSTRLFELNCRSKELEFDVDQFIRGQEEHLKIKLTDKQMSFIHNIKKNNVNLLIGYAGTGKSQMQKLLINLLRELKITYRFLSPTGKAAKILSSYVGEEATTIHRAIGFDMKGTIEEQFVIVDEASMLGVVLASRLLRNCKHTNLRILFVGDPFQLPSVDAGCLLHDIISSNQIPVTELNQVFRQEEGGILDIATKIREGKQFIENDFAGHVLFGSDLDFYSVPQEKMIGGYKYGFNKQLERYSPDDVMVLSSTKKGSLGTISINNVLQEIVNPKADSKSEHEYGTGIFYRVGDSIINTKNLYDTETVDEEKTTVVNGDLGKIIEIDTENKKMVIDYGFAKVPVGFNDLDTILHSYCITIHKSQGSAAKAVVVVFDKSHTYQLNANLIYTAITRAREHVFMLCQANVINRAIKKVANMQRNTFLKDLLISQNA
ncbi:SF1B family DNA helicase RecD2 [Brevibacillus sp. NRS-1366]|uniref:SF1B family DNA helicase RecD2 n=1 Tax=Brevibacillus sp. NRS-1366 TaxID=3233899 RepID=UPI003D1AE18D